tara:strand:- start:11 stop:484 length:474 start_codon:yes stop_codon:yes gene_type:complete
MSETFYNFKLDLEPNLIDMIYDILRMSTIQLVTQIMFYMNNSSLSLFSETFIKTFIFINFGIIVYYLLIRKLFSFVSDDYLRVTDNEYVSTPPMNTATPSNLPKAPAMPPPPAVPAGPKVVSNNSPKNSSNTSINSLPNNTSTNIVNNSTNTPINSN